MITLTTIAMLLALSQPETHLSIQPWTGNDFQATSTDAARYRLEVSGPPNATIHLQTSGLANGWIAAFCTPKVCSPQRIDFDLPRSGQAIIQFELIRESDSAPHESAATITGGDGSTITVPTAYR